jgi:3-oxoacyl-[acyl-carrier-protein] synthase II
MPDPNCRVVVTGLGAVSSLGLGADDFAAAVRAGRSGISSIQSFDTTGFPHFMAGEVHGFEPGRWLQRLHEEEWGRSSLFAATAARQAVTDSGMDPDELHRSRAGSCVGTTSGESVVIEQLVAQWVDDGNMAGLDTTLIGQLPASQLAVAVNRELGLTGDAITLSTACSASNYALGYAFDLVRTAQADFMVCGGADSVCRWAHAGFYRLGALAEQVCRPFDADRTGILTAEGGVALLLERYDHAIARDAHIYAEVLGYGLNCDAKHPVQPDPDSIAECIRSAHRNAGVRSDEIDYICAHGTGTRANDSAEVGAIRQIFGSDPPPVSSIKSMIGHAMGAASGFGALMCCKAIDEGFLPPTANVQNIDSEFGPDFDCVAGQARPAEVRVAENHGFAFGGNNAITILGRVS